MRLNTGLCVHIAVFVDNLKGGGGGGGGGGMIRIVEKCSETSFQVITHSTTFCVAELVNG